MQRLVNTHARFVRFLLLGMLACSALSTVQAADKPLSEEDLRWINRVTYGADSSTMKQYRAAGRRHFLEEQLFTY